MVSKIKVSNCMYNMFFFVLHISGRTHLKWVFPQEESWVTMGKGDLLFLVHLFFVCVPSECFIMGMYCSFKTK